MNDGTRSVPPSLVANATCGFTAGLEPPSRGLRMAAAAAIEIHPRTEASSHRFFRGEFRRARREVARFGSGQPLIAPPAPTAPARTPGSLALVTVGAGAAALLD